MLRYNTSKEKSNNCSSHCFLCSNTNVKTMLSLAKIICDMRPSKATGKLVFEIILIIALMLLMALVVISI